MNIGVGVRIVLIVVLLSVILVSNRFQEPYSSLLRITTVLTAVVIIYYMTFKKKD
jgi:hypothetical protein